MNSTLRFGSLLWLIVCLCCASPGLKAQTLDPGFASADTTVNAIAVDGNYTYIGGLFKNLGLRTGHGIKLSTISDAPNMSFAQVNDDVLTAVADGAGGWYIGGVFTEVGGLPRNHLARIQSNGTVDPDWDPGADDIVLTLAVSGSSVYAGGIFTTIGGVAMNGIAKLDNVTGAGDIGWISGLNFPSYVSAITASGGYLYAGGVFDAIGGLVMNNIAKLDTATGNADASWNPNANGQVRSIAINGNDMYVGGDFDTLGHVSRTYLAKVGLASGSVDYSWVPQVDGSIYSIASTGTELYIGGAFTNVGGSTRNFIAKMSTTTAAVDGGWNANANDGVLSLAIIGSSVYAAGVFDSLGGQPAKYLARLNNSTGAADASWKPNVNATVYCMAINGTDIYAVGAFTMAKAVERNGIARINNTTGVVDESWDPGSVNPAAWPVISGFGISDIVVDGMGVFINYTSAVRKIDKVTGILAPTWIATTNGNIDCIASDGNVIYFGGYFDIAGTASVRRCLAAKDNINGFTTSWNPNVPGSSSEVFALALDGQDIYAGGQFTSAGGGSATNIARLNNTTGALKPFTSVSNNGFVNSIAITGSEMYLGRSYTSAGLVKILMPDRSVVSAWAPNPDGNTAFATTSGPDVYAAGDFTTIGGQARNYLAKLNNVDGAADASWNPDPNDIVTALSVKDSFVYVGGRFSTIGGTDKQGIARFKVPMPVSYPTWTGAVSSRWQDGGNWSTGVVPGLKDSVVIPTGTPNAPNLDSAIYTVKNFTQTAGQTMTLGANGGVIVTGTYINNGTVTGAGKIVLNGTAAQTITGNGTVSNLEIDNANGATVDTAATDTLKITGLLTLTSGTLTTNSKLILKSTSATATAMVGPIPASGAGVSGTVVHERYLSAPANTSGGRGWRLLTSPLSNATDTSIFYHWQNNGVNDGTGVELFGLGGTGAAGNGLAQGGVTTSSIRSFNYLTNAYVSVTNTKTTALFSNGMNNTFLTFVTGPYGSNYINSGAAPANSDAYGTLITGTQNYSFTPPNAANIYYLMGNPYACPIDFDKMYSNGGTTKINRKFWVIDPNLSSVGAYVTVTYTGGSYITSTGSQNQYIQTGQGFFVEGNDPTNLSTVAIEEDDKETGAAQTAVFRTNGGSLETFRVKLYKNATLLDGTVVASHQTSNNAIDNVDGLKFGNFNENIGIYSSGKLLAVEARQLLDNNDTVKVAVSNMQQTAYQLVFEPGNMAASGLTAMLIDNFTNTTTPVSLTANTTYNFSVTSAAASTGTGRFNVVFTSITPLALKFINTNATKHGDKVDVQWTVASQDGINIYEVERSSDAKTFTKIATVQAGSEATYSYTDAAPLNGNNYYRIKAIARSDNNGVYSSIVRVNMNGTNAALSTYPNPVIDGHLQISIANLAQGSYTITLYNTAGQIVATKQLAYQGSSTIIDMDITSLASGIYLMHLTNENGETIAEQKIVKQ